jgi:hypothetical protein
MRGAPTAGAHNAASPPTRGHGAQWEHSVRAVSAGLPPPPPPGLAGACGEPLFQGVLHALIELGDNRLEFLNW